MAMTLFGITTTGNAVELFPTELSWVQEEDKPCDTLSCTMGNRPPLLRELQLWQEGKLVYRGIIDEEMVLQSQEGTVTTLTSRSTMAHLVDCEAMPQNLTTYSLAEFHNQYGKHLGIIGIEGDSRVYPFSYTVQIGQSVYQLLLSFCKACLQVTPRLTPEGVLDCSGKQKKGVIPFGSGGFGYDSLCVIRKPKERIARLYLQQTPGASYDVCLLDNEAIQWGVSRSCYRQAPRTEGAVQLETGKEKSRVVQLTCKEMAGSVGQQAMLVEDAKTRYRIGKIQWKKSKAGQKCTVTLYRETENQEEVYG